MKDSQKIAGLICLVLVVIGGIVLYAVLSGRSSGSMQPETKQMKAGARGHKGT